MKPWIVIIIIISIGVLLFAGYKTNWFGLSKNNSTDIQTTKIALVNQILTTMPNVDVTRDFLMNKDISYLQGILNGTIK